MKVGEQLAGCSPIRVWGAITIDVGEHVATREIESPIGKLRLAASDAGLVRIALPIDTQSFSGWLRKALPDAESVTDLPALESGARELGEYFEGSRRSFSVPLDPRGTPFQQAVWQALLAIPYGETRSYGAIARAVTRPGASRAVGLANGANPLPLVIPCHRVIESSGRLGGYGGGLEAKRWLLGFEQDVARGQLI